MMGVDGMQKMPMSGDTDKDFAMMVLMHHQHAVNIAETKLASGQSPAMKAMAKQIIAAQKRDRAVRPVALQAEVSDGPVGRAYLRIVALLHWIAERPAVSCCGALRGIATARQQSGRAQRSSPPGTTACSRPVRRILAV
jgi:hypothetical protein